MRHIAGYARVVLPFRRLQMKTRLSLFVVLTLLCLAGKAGLAAGYTITDLGTLPGYTWSRAWDINAAGQIVGVSFTASEDSHACLWQDGTTTDLGTLPGDTWSEAYGINEAGQIVGNSTSTASGAVHAVLWQNGTITDLGTLGRAYATASDINEAGQIVGCAGTATGDTPACLWQNGGITDLGTLGGNSSLAYGINEAGQIVGESSTASGAVHAVLWQNGTITDLGTLGSDTSCALDINEAGQIVGLSDTASGAAHAVLWQNGTITDLGTLPGRVNSYAYAINDAGQIVGASSTASGAAHAVLWQNGTITDLGTLGGTSSWAFGINDAGQIVGMSTTPSGDTHACLWQPTWAVLYYLMNAADENGDLESWCSAKFATIAQAASNQHVQAWVLWDHAAAGDADGVYRMKGSSDWRSGYTRSVDFWTATDIGLAKAEMNTGDVGTLNAFVDFVTAQQTAGHWVLVIFDHGGGVYPRAPRQEGLAPVAERSIGFDGTSSIAVSELGDACQHLASVTGQRLAVLHLDACLMQMAEVNYELRNSCLYLVASENEGWASSFEGSYLSSISATTSPLGLATSIASGYFSSLPGYGRTVSVTRPDQMGGVAAAVEDLAAALIANLSTARPGIRAARNDAQKFAYFDDTQTMTQSNIYLDLEDFCLELIEHVSDPAIVQAASAVIAAIGGTGDTLLPYEAHESGSGYDLGVGTYGLSIFFPRSMADPYRNYINASTTPANLAFSADTLWDEFLQAYLQTTDTTGLYNGGTGTFYLRNTNSAGAADLTFRFGPSGAGWSPIAGDYDADGDDTVGLYNPTMSTFYLKNANSAGAADLTFRFGPSGAGWKPVIGDWDGEGTKTIGLYNPATSTFYLRNANSAGAADVTFRFGPSGAGWLPMVGDWNGDGIDTVGLYDPATGIFYLHNANSAGAANLTFRFGPTSSTWKPIAGDWNQDGSDTVGLYNPATGTLYLRNLNSAGSANYTFRYGPKPSTWLPLAGDWDGM